jgi:MoaA/NifB/PqqE/SkfB family radical SAM enzyme
MGTVDTLCIEVTTRCPLRCVHCSADASPDRTDLFPAAVYESVVGRLSALQAVFLSGGEPFDHPELERFVEVSRRAAREVVIYSSGTQRSSGRAIPLYEERLASVAIRGLSRIDLSVYSNRPEEHDAVTRTGGSFTAVIETMRLCRALGIQFGIHFVPLVEGGARVRAVAGLAREMRSARFHALAPVAQGRGANLTTTLSPGFLKDVAALHDDPAFNVVLSSAIRRALGRSATERDSLKAVFVDVRGTVHPSEGRRLPLIGGRMAEADVLRQFELMR